MLSYIHIIFLYTTGYGFPPLLATTERGILLYILLKIPTIQKYSKKDIAKEKKGTCGNIIKNKSKQYQIAGLFHLKPKQTKKIIQLGSYSIFVILNCM